MSHKHEQLLRTIFHDPISGNVHWRDVESLLKHVGASLESARPDASSLLRIIREVLDFRPERRGTNIAEGLRFLTGAIKKRSIVFLISDFIDEGYEDALRIAGRKHDLVGIKLFDLVLTWLRVV